MPPTPDPMDLILAKARADVDQVTVFWNEHLDRLIAAYRSQIPKYDRNLLLMNTVKSLMESDNDREALCYQVMCLVDREARAK